MGAVVVYPDVAGCAVKFCTEEMLESSTAAGWSLVGSIHRDEGSMSFLLSKPRQDAADRQLRAVAREAFHAGAVATRDAVKSKGRLDPVAAAEEYAAKLVTF